MRSVFLGRHQDDSLAVGERGSSEATNGAVEKFLILIELHDVIARSRISQQVTPRPAVVSNAVTRLFVDMAHDSLLSGLFGVSWHVRTPLIQERPREAKISPSMKPWSAAPVRDFRAAFRDAFGEPCYMLCCSIACAGGGVALGLALCLRENCLQLGPSRAQPLLLPRAPTRMSGQKQRMAADLILFERAPANRSMQGLGPIAASSEDPVEKRDLR